MVLKPGGKVSPALAPNLDSALELYVRGLLEERYPRHPKFTKKLTRQRVERLVEKFGDIVDADEKRIPADREFTSEMGGTLAQLGLVRVTEDAVHLVADKALQELENKREQQSATSRKCSSFDAGSMRAGGWDSPRRRRTSRFAATLAGPRGRSCSPGCRSRRTPARPFPRCCAREAASAADRRVGEGLEHGGCDLWHHDGGQGTAWGQPQAVRRRCSNDHLKKSAAPAAKLPTALQTRRGA